MTTPKRKVPEIPSTSTAVAVEDPPGTPAESVEATEGNSADQPTNHAPELGDADELVGDGPVSAGPPAGDSIITEITEITAMTELAELTERISALEAAFAVQQRALADVGDRITSEITAEVERVTTDELVEAKRNLSLAANSMAHLALGITESAQNISGELRPDSITALLYSFRAEVDNILLQLGFAPLDTQVGERFDPNRHRALRRIPTDDVSLDRLIGKVIREGYRSERTRRMLVYSDVEVNRYQPG